MFPSNKKQSKGQKKSINKSSPFRNITECGAKYLLSAAMPFHSDVEGVCVPVFPSRPSKKVSSTAEGIIVTNGSSTDPYGEAFLAVSPCLAKSKTSFYYSSPSWVGNSLELAVGAQPEGVLEGTQYGCGHNYSALTDETTAASASYAARMVSVGVRVKCISNPDKVGGLMYAVVNSQHDNLNGLTGAQLRDHPDAVKVNISTEWTTVSMNAISPMEVEYPVHGAFAHSADINMMRTFPFCNNQTLEGNSWYGGVPIVFWISGEPGAKYDFEIVQHIELVGRDVAPALLTPSHIDDDAFQATQIAAVRGINERASRPATSLPRSVFKHAAAYLEDASNMSRDGSKFLKNAVETFNNVKTGYSAVMGAAALLG